jgi:hypothetical protein
MDVLWEGRTVKKAVLAAVVVGALSFAPTSSVILVGQAQRSATDATAQAKPIPRTAWDGHPDLSGVWGGPHVGAVNMDLLHRLYRPEAASKRSQYKESNDPVLHCAPYGYPRAITMVHPVQVVQAPGLMLLLAEYNHSFRVIPTDGRQPQGIPRPSYQGTSRGRWEGDTLVVDITDFNGQVWLGHGLQKMGPAGTSGWITSDALHMVEHWRLLNRDTLEYEVVVEDPKMLVGPWTKKIVRYREAYDKIEEAVCVDDSLVRGLIAAQEKETTPK